MTTAEALKTLRRQQALTQQELADRAGVNRVTIARIETGVDQPIPRTLRKIAAALKVGPDALIDAWPPVEEPPGWPSQFDPQIALPGINVRDPDGIARRILVDNPSIVDVLREATVQVPTFMPDARLHLEARADPEDGEFDLFLGIESTLRGDDAFNALRRFDEEWWFKNSRRALELIIGYEYHDVRLA